MSEQEVFDIIVKNVLETLPELAEYNFQPNDVFTDLGANSIDRTEIILMTMEDLDFKIPRVELHGAKNIGELAEIFYEKLRNS